MMALLDRTKMVPWIRITGHEVMNKVAESIADRRRIEEKMEEMKQRAERPKVENLPMLEDLISALSVGYHPYEWAANKGFLVRTAVIYYRKARVAKRNGFLRTDVDLERPVDASGCLREKK